MGESRSSCGILSLQNDAKLIRRDRAIAASAASSVAILPQRQSFTLYVQNQHKIFSVTASMRLAISVGEIARYPGRMRNITVKARRYTGSGRSLIGTDAS